MSERPETLTLMQAAERLGIGRNTAYQAAREGRFPVPLIHVGKRIVVPAKALDRLLDGAA